ncbi:MAG TPA: Crp/Fnr family transcriptional regulator [Candidatus Acidoferrum sp.]|nr:Crp/Fnr family transcriptional regulator [Candidatus Acidoferrum sp.]
MRGPYGFELNENCQSCKVRASGFFCQLSPDATKDFNAIRTSATYPAGAILFLEKQEPRGLFVICGGEVKLSISSSAGKTLILRLAKAGEVLGLMATMSGSPYEVTAETLHPCHVAFIRRDDFLQFVAKHTEAYQGVVKQLSSLYSGACAQLRTVALSASAPEKLARLLLDWSAESKDAKQGTPVKLPLTHEEIAEFIGTTRETVTRTLSDFKSRQLVALHGSTLLISNRSALEAIGGA